MNEIPSRNKTVTISLQTKLSVLIIFTATLIFSGYVFYNYVTVRDVMRTELHNLSGFWTKQLAESLKIPLWEYNTKAVEGIVKSIMLEKQMYAIVVRNNNGIVLCGIIRDNQWDIVRTEQQLFEYEYAKKEDIVHENKKLGSVELCPSDIFMRNKLTEDTLELLITVVILNMALICSIFIGVRKSIVLPVRRIVGSVRIIASGKLDVEVLNERNDEIGQLASDVDMMRLAIKDMTENLKEQERLKNEMELAKKIQTVLLPKNPVISGYEIAASMQPSEEVGGDYYDVISIGGYDWVVIGDVSGHGITAGLVMMMVQASIHTVLIQNPEVPPSYLLSVINRTIYENILRMGESKHMTIIVLACGKNGVFCFSGLHEDMLIRRAGTGTVEKIGSDGMWIGLEPDISGFLSDSRLKMNIGDCIVLYTDGVTEAWDRQGNMFGENRLIKIIESSCGKSAGEIHDAIWEVLKDYEKPDDVTLFVMKRV